MTQSLLGCSSRYPSTLAISNMCGFSLGRYTLMNQFEDVSMKVSDKNVGSKFVSSVATLSVYGLGGIGAGTLIGKALTDPFGVTMLFYCAMFIFMVVFSALYALFGDSE